MSAVTTRSYYFQTTSLAQCELLAFGAVHDVCGVLLHRLLHEAQKMFLVHTRRCVYVSVDLRGVRKHHASVQT